MSDMWALGALELHIFPWVGRTCDLPPGKMVVKSYAVLIVVLSFDSVFIRPSFARKRTMGLVTCSRESLPSFGFRRTKTIIADLLSKSN